MPATVSFILPVHNAVDTVELALERIISADLGQPGLQREIIVVDDTSDDGTAEVLRRAAARGLARVAFHAETLGQGAALSTALPLVTGDFVIMADASMAYDPADCGKLLAPILAGEADVVYGARNIAPTRQVPRLWDRVADRILTAVSNGLTNVALSDVTSTFQAFRADVVRGAVFRADGCGIAGELAALFSTRACRIFEVPVSYRMPRPVSAATRWFQGLSHVTMMARSRLRNWQLEPLTPHQPYRAAALAAPRGARLTRLVLPMDLMPMTTAGTRPTLSAN